MKRVWINKKLSYIFEGRPSTNLALFMQALYAHSIVYLPILRLRISSTWTWFSCDLLFKLALGVQHLISIFYICIRGMEFNLNKLKQMSTDYANLKKIATDEGISVINDDEDITKGISRDKKLIGDKMEEIAREWDAQREVFHQQTGLVQEHQLQLQEDDDTFDLELEQMLSET
ncbi:uncharacterized protein LOC121050145 [Rosa chinensis]|uniref:uncharacterized protein LOC121050145 n=1 Tax=Rosa chinensis TaxID=74649 RepID=UPI001AD8BC07|nr:uncharacterized protein LOC121050145 [Rosa chinensis]